MLASINPCGFAMLPSMVSFYLGLDTDDATWRPVWRRLGDGLALGALVTAGVLLVFVLAGALVSLGAGGLVRVFPWVTTAVRAGLVVLGGWLFLGRGLSVWLPHHEAPRVAGSSRAMFAYGIAYALASLGCTPPIFLVAVGTAVASGPLASPAQFVAYGLGMGGGRDGRRAGRGRISGHRGPGPAPPGALRAAGERPAAGGRRWLCALSGSAACAGLIV
jgi:cytochrome c biogenesis protein CcdA